MRSGGFQAGAGTNDKPKGGPGVLLETLEDVVGFINSMKPWHQTRPYWDRCAGEILKAAMTGKRTDIAEATRRPSASQTVVSANSNYFPAQN
jgi:hypothetical protein